LTNQELSTGQTGRPVFGVYFFREKQTRTS
jgi:hypothetical protein